MKKFCGICGDVVAGLREIPLDEKSRDENRSRINFARVTRESASSLRVIALAYDSLLDYSRANRRALNSLLARARERKRRTTLSIRALIDLASRRSSGSTARVVLDIPYVGIETGMENDRRIAGGWRTRGQSRDRVAKRGRDRLDKGGRWEDTSEGR